MDTGTLVLPALWVITAVLVVAVAITQGGAVPYFLTAWPRWTAVVLGVPLVAWIVQAYPLLVFLHVVGAFVFVAAHAVSAFVAFALAGEEDGRRAAALLDISSWGLVGMHAGLGVLLLAGIGAAFVGNWWGRPWIWISLDLLLAITAYMYFANSGKAYNRARRRVADEGPDGWDADARAAVDRRQAVRFMLTGSLALVAILGLMVFKPG